VFAHEGIPLFDVFRSPEQRRLVHALATVKRPGSRCAIPAPALLGGACGRRDSQSGPGADLETRHAASAGCVRRVLRGVHPRDEPARPGARNWRRESPPRTSRLRACTPRWPGCAARRSRPWLRPSIIQKRARKPLRRCAASSTPSFWRRTRASRLRALAIRCALPASIFGCGGGIW